MKKFRDLQVGDHLHIITNCGYLYVTMPITEINTYSSEIIFTGLSPEQKIIISSPYANEAIVRNCYVMSNVDQVVSRYASLGISNKNIEELREVVYEHEQIDILKHKIKNATDLYMDNKQEIEQYLKQYESND